MSATSGPRWAILMAVLALSAVLATPAAAQDAGNQGRITLSGGIDFTNAYVFRGIRQDDTRVIMWPFADAAVNLHRGTGGVEDVTVHVGTWNSLHTGSAGIAGPSGQMWYESDFYSTLAIGFDGGVGVGATYTAYTSPNSSFTTVKELAFRVGADGVSPAGFALRPYALVAFELDTSPGVGQADGGFNAGTYLEGGIAPSIEGGTLTLSFPIRIGLSLDDYYELAGEDHPFGFLGIGAIGTLPLASTAGYGDWDLRGGVEFLSLGDTPEAFNGGDQSKLVAMIGIVFRY